MTSVKLKFRPSTVADKEGVIYYQIICERKVRQISTGYRIFPNEWNDKRSMIVGNDDSDRHTYILLVREFVRRDMNRLSHIIKSFENRDFPFLIDDIIDEYHRYIREYTLFKFMESLIVYFKRKGKFRTSETYTTTLNSFKKFLYEAERQRLLLQGNDIMLDCITADLIESYETYLQRCGITTNTTSFYMRVLRATYNRAVERNIVEQLNPFRHVYTGVDKTVKRALGVRQIKQIKALDLSLHPMVDFARDMFMMSFYTRGMSFVDMAFLRKSDLKDGVLSYRRHKTGQLLNIRWTTEMQTLLNKYPENPTQYLLPIITNLKAQERYSYRNMSYVINRNLKKIAEILGINIPLTMYVARHSWASIAKAKGIPISVISEGMGHDSETTTQIYLTSLDTNIVDKANSLILKSI